MVTQEPTLDRLITRSTQGTIPPMSGREADDPAPAALLRTRADANPLGPMVTAPLSVERAPTASGGPAAVAVAINDMLRKVGVRKGLRVLGAANRVGGFECPGCAWPSPAQPPGFAVCESGARAIVDELAARVAGPQLFATYTIPELSRRTDHWLGGQGRLTQPMIRRADSNGYVPISWDEAIALIGKELRGLDVSGGPNRAVFYSSARISNEAAFCLQLLARELGTNNLASSSQLCHEPAAWPCTARSAAAVARSRSPTSPTPRRSSCSGKTPAAITRACSRPCATRSCAGPRSSRSIRCAKSGCCACVTRGVCATGWARALRSRICICRSASRVTSRCSKV
jgi:hypothetical protein